MHPGLFCENISQAAIRINSQFYARCGRFQHSCVSLRRFPTHSGHLSVFSAYPHFNGVLPVLRFAFIYLPADPFAPPELPGFNTTMAALTSARTAIPASSPCFTHSYFTAFRFQTPHCTRFMLSPMTLSPEKQIQHQRLMILIVPDRLISSPFCEFSTLIKRTAHSSTIWRRLP